MIRFIINILVPTHVLVLIGFKLSENPRNPLRDSAKKIASFMAGVSYGKGSLLSDYWSSSKHVGLSQSCGGV
ncbi:hypothetical protein BH23BAC3_BH23BAC3_04010 [soil metagenome]